MRRLTDAGVVIFLATATGFTVGAASVVVISFVFWGLSGWVGLAVGALAGFVSGVLAVADGEARFGGGGQWTGLVIGLLAAAGEVGYAVAYGPGGVLLTVFVFAGGAGWLSGRLSERVGRAVTDV